MGAVGMGQRVVVVAGAAVIQAVVGAVVGAAALEA